MSKKKEQHLKNRISKTPKKRFKLKVKILTSWTEKVNGLTNTTNIYPVYFETRFGIHTFGVKKPIDVLILNNKNMVVKIKRNLKPGRVFFWNPFYSKVIEIPTGFIKVEVLDKISIF